MNYLNKSKFVVILFIFISFNSFGQIQWDSCSEINWGNFKGPPPEKTEFKATTTTFFKCEYGSNDTCFFYTVKNLFDELKSWHKDSSKYLLNHERGHFDISEIYARKIRKFLKINLRKEISDINIRKGIGALEKQEVAYQKLYDAETNYSIDSEKQIQWLSTIQNQLKQLDDYKQSEYSNCPQG